ncbi:hypothetical protein PoB_004464100 [Plakobranchus ocellatus]|uniref:Nanos-type domain-containing protein n=1 Tax=Plakobranchus ocellatus TaxID=259542 RepID=A0AAV4BH01_9GAST|nr:hypothetical protein PoB_004464100 [Plakobranchus ocellatus]
MTSTIMTRKVTCLMERPWLPVRSLVLLQPLYSTDNSFTSGKLPPKRFSLVKLASITNPQNKNMISGFHALRQARAPVAGLEPATEGSLQISGRFCYSFWHQCLLEREQSGEVYECPKKDTIENSSQTSKRPRSMLMRFLCPFCRFNIELEH